MAEAGENSYAVFMHCHPELSGGITTLTARNGGSKLLCSNGHLDRSRCVILSFQVVSLPLQSVMEVANFCAAMDTLIDEDDVLFKPARRLMLMIQNNRYISEQSYEILKHLKFYRVGVTTI